MRLPIIRLTVVLVVIALPSSVWAECVAQGTAEARMACCAHGAQCPMHTDRSSDSRQSVTQAQADRCCRISGSAPSPSSIPGGVVVPVTLAVISVGGSAVSTNLVRREGARETFVPIVVSPVARHLLLSVFLV